MTWAAGVAKWLKTCHSLEDTNKCFEEEVDDNNDYNHSYTAVTLFINENNVKSLVDRACGSCLNCFANFGENFY